MAPIRWLLAASLVLPVIGCGQSASRGPATLPAGKASRQGWEVRYNAVVALARRGSDTVKDHIDVMQEMLDEDQQLQNFRTKLQDGREIADEQSARTTVINALKAVAELHRRKPDMDLSPLYPAIDKLQQSGNLVVRTEAERTNNGLNRK